MSKFKFRTTLKIINKIKKYFSSNMEKSKHSKGESSENNKLQKKTQEEKLNAIQLKSIERDCLDRVYKLLCELEDQPSSDDDNKQKKYLMEIEKKANQKKMKLVIKNKASSGSSSNSSPLKNENRFKEDENNNNKNSPGGRAVDEYGKKVGVKAVRKILKKLEQELPKEEMHMMVWVIFFYLVVVLADFLFCLSLFFYYFR